MMLTTVIVISLLSFFYHDADGDDVDDGDDAHDDDRDDDVHIDGDDGDHDGVADNDDADEKIYYLWVFIMTLLTTSQ
eukprot:6497562-Karenia_brevis.AAC.1